MTTMMTAMMVALRAKWIWRWIKDTRFSGFGPDRTLNSKRPNSSEYACMRCRPWVQVTLPQRRQLTVADLREHWSMHRRAHTLYGRSSTRTHARTDRRKHELFVHKWRSTRRVGRLVDMRRPLTVAASRWQYSPRNVTILAPLSGNASPSSLYKHYGCRLSRSSESRIYVYMITHKITTIKYISNDIFLHTSWQSSSGR